tara:strand:- start:42 stop:149 length:108 start_codon:yes stop_codon:yes gene_type:complete
LHVFDDDDDFFIVDALVGGGLILVCGCENSCELKL